MPDLGTSKHRSSRACTACRAKHVRCDAALPRCTRCVGEEKECVYVKSRRGGRRRVLNTLTSSMNGTKMDQESFISILPILSQTGTRELNPGFNLTTSTSAPSGTVDDQLLSLYYRYFHSAHPCAVPRFAIQRYAVSDRRAIQPLYAVMKYIGSLHNALIQSE